MSIAGSARLLVVLFATLVIVVFVDTRATFAQDITDSPTDDYVTNSSATPDSGTTASTTSDSATNDSAAPGTSASAPSAAATSASTASDTTTTASTTSDTVASDDSITSDDANAEDADPIGPPIDASAASAQKVLEIPQAKCANDDPTAPCEGADASHAGTDDDQSMNAPLPGAAPQQAFDDDTAYAPEADWGTVDEYQNQQAYSAYYPVYPYYLPGGGGVISRPAQLPSSALATMSSPLTQAARPPLLQGAWMTPPSMSMFARPAGSPMRMSAPFVGIHH